MIRTMKTFPLPPPRAGTALVLVLSFILLLSVLLTAFLSRAMLNRQIAYSSMGQFKADQVAQAGVNTFIGDLRQEIIAGSCQGTDPTGLQYTRNGVAIYVPTAPSASGVTTAAPARIGENPALKTLLRRSVRSDQSGTPTAFPAQDGVRALRCRDLHKHRRRAAQPRLPEQQPERQRQRPHHHYQPLEQGRAD